MGAGGLDVLEEAAGHPELLAACRAWARNVARNPSDTSAADAQALRYVGAAIRRSSRSPTLVALRIALSTVNDALGARPDAAFRSTAPQAVLRAVTFGRPIDDEAAGTEHRLT